MPRRLPMQQHVLLIEDDARIRDIVERGLRTRGFVVSSAADGISGAGIAAKRPVDLALLDFDPGSNVVDVYVSALRRKLGADAIETVRGVGYRLPAAAAA